MLYEKSGLVKEGEAFVLRQSWKEVGGLREMGLMKATFITVSLDMNLPVGHLPDQFWSLMYMPGHEDICTLQSIHLCWCDTDFSKRTSVGLGKSKPRVKESTQGV